MNNSTGPLNLCRSRMKAEKVRKADTRTKKEKEYHQDF